MAGAEALMNLLYDCGFDVRQIDLTQDDISDDARILVIFNPKYDFHGLEAESENYDFKIMIYLEVMQYG